MQEALYIHHTPSATPYDYFQLLKPRVMSLVVFTALSGILIAQGAHHIYIDFIAILCIAVAAGASGCLNQWFERNTDKRMKRTQNRPIPAGIIAPESALNFGIILSLGAVYLMAVCVNYLSSALLVFTIVYYAYFYTVILKPNTDQNIVIGGAAGALPPLIGYAAVTNTVDWLSFSLFLVIFLWTPAHFWALSLKCGEDYKMAEIPMLPNTKGHPFTQYQIFVYTMLTVAASYLPLCLMEKTNLFAVLSLSLFNIVFSISALKLLKQATHEATLREALRVFFISILYLFGIFFIYVINQF